MSMLRLLSPSRTSHGGSSPSRSRTRKNTTENEEITMTIRVPCYGTIFMNPPDDPLWPIALSDRPRDDQLLLGELDILVPKGSTRRRCKSIRVGLRTTSRLNMGPSRGWEEDVIFERKCEVRGGTSEGLWLDEGLQRFDFTLIVPSTIAAHDWHHNGKVTQHLFAEIEGLPETSSSSPNFFSFSRPRIGSQGSFTGSFRGSNTPVSQRSLSRSPSPLGSYGTRSPLDSPPPLSPILAAASNLSITRQEAPFSLDTFTNVESFTLPQAPSYAESEAQAEANVINANVNANANSKGKDKDATDQHWIKGIVSVTRDLGVMHNPNRHGWFCDLDERQSGFAPGIGVYDLKMFSDVFSIGGPVHARLTLPDLSPKATIFSWRLLLSQTHEISSPRDDPLKETTKPISTTRSFTLVEHGQKPPPNVRNPDTSYPAMYRGIQAGGNDTRSFFKIEGHGTMPKDDRGRPTTLPGVVTPIKVSHKLVYEVFFSIWGENDHGDIMEKEGPGGLRYMRLERPIIVPSCALIPSVLDLPKYAFTSTDSPCTTCGSPPSDQLCLSCPPTILPHPRHDHPPTLVGNKEGICPECSGSVLPSGDGNDKAELCACGLGIENIEERMKRFVLEGLEGDYSFNDRDSREEAERLLRDKEDAERGRSRGRSPVRSRR